MLISIVCMPAISAESNIDTTQINEETKENLDVRLQKAVETYNKVVTNRNSSWNEVTTCTDKIDQIVDEINFIGMDVDFKQTSEVHTNDKGEVLPACISAEITPTMLSKSYTFNTNESTRIILSEICGTNITIGEYMEKVFPDMLEVISKDTMSYYQNTPMTWSDLDKKETNQKQIPLSTRSTVVYEATSSSDQTLHPVETPPNADFYSETKMRLPTAYTRIPEITVNSIMYMDGENIEATVSHGINTYKQKASYNGASISYGYHSYYTSGFHAMIWPIGCYPVSSSVLTETPIEYCGIS